MATPRQNSRNGKARYPGSKMEVLNKARRLAGYLNPLKDTDALGVDFLATKDGRITLLSEYHARTPKVDELCGEYEAHLLIEDVYNAGRCNTIWVDAGTAKPDRAGNYLCDTANGLALLPGNTLVFWK